MSIITEVRHNIVEQLFKIDDLELLRPIEGLVKPNVSETAQTVIDNNQPDEDLPNPDDPMYRVQELGTLEELSKKQGVQPMSREAWAEMADLYTVIPDDYLEESMRID